ncbi:MAG: DNA primase [Deltaproteobacteria bacterium]|nr:DNA primase [Deltaproteobacteria bacterium]
MISDQTTQEVRARASIAEVVSDYVTLKKAGQNYSGLCPFHSEKTPSFTVNEEKGVFYCFGCREGGDVFKFVMLYDGLTFPESVERLAERYGIPIEQSGSGGNRRGDLFRLNEQAAAWYHGLLLDPARGTPARHYLQKRGVDESLWPRFNLGFAPRGDGLASHLRRMGAVPADAAAAGLLVERERGRFRDRFFDRVIFPITEPGGKIVGFGGRVLGEGAPKYLNSPETPLFHKSAQVYGLKQARDGIRAADRVVVVEGYLDVLSLAQYGVAHAVATLGTALTVDHLRVLARYTRNVTALFDGDAAGRAAAARSVEVFQQAGLWGQAAFLPGNEDPDTFVRAHGKDALESVLERAVPIVDFYLDWLRERHGTSLEGKSRSAAEVSRILAKVTNPNDRDLLARRAADLLGVREESLRRHAGGGPAAGARPAGNERRGAGRPMPRGADRWTFPDDRAEVSLVALMLRFPAVVTALRREPMDKLVSGKWSEVIRRMFANAGDDGELEVGALTEGLSPELASEVTGLVLQGQEFAESERERMTRDCLLFLKRRYLNRLDRELCRAIRVAEETRDDAAKKERMRQWQEVMQKKLRLERAVPGL